MEVGAFEIDGASEAMSRSLQESEPLRCADASTDQTFTSGLPALAITNDSPFRCVIAGRELRPGLVNVDGAHERIDPTRSPVCGAVDEAIRPPRRN